MATYLGQASQNEFGGISGGKAGDQTKKEVYIRTYYSFPWNVYLEPIGDDFGNKIANNMIDACNNDNIGYDQPYRNTCKDVNQKTKCSTDCSALVSLCVTQAGCDILSGRTNAPTTSTLRGVLLGTKRFRVVGTPTKRGTILLREGHHTAIYLGNTTNKQGGGSNPTPAPTPTPSSSGAIDVTYRTKYGTTWLPWVKNTQDYAGLPNKPIIALQSKVSKGRIKYRVYGGGKWSSWVYDGAEASLGGAYITAIEMYLYSPNNDKCIYYRVAPIKKNYYPYQKDNVKGGGMDGYAGDKQNKLDKIQMYIK